SVFACRSAALRGLQSFLHDALPIFYLDGPLAADRLGLALRGGWSRRDAAHISYQDDSGNEVEPWMGANPVEAHRHNVGARLSWTDRKSTRLNSSHVKISYAVSCLKK